MRSRAQRAIESACPLPFRSMHELGVDGVDGPNAVAARKCRRCLVLFVAAICVLSVACDGPESPPAVPSATPTTATAVASATAAASTAPSAEEPARILVLAAEAFARGEEAPHELSVLQHAARRVGASDQGPDQPRYIVAMALAKLRSAEATRALRRWGLAGNVTPGGRWAVTAALSSGADEHVPLIEELLADPRYGAQTYMGGGPRFTRAVAMQGRTSLHARLLGALVRIGSARANALLLRYATSNEYAAPNPATIADIRCAFGRPPHALEARGLASLRVMALSVIPDEAVVAQAANDPTAPDLVRYWARRMLRGPDAAALQRVKDVIEQDGRDRRRVGKDEMWIPMSPCPWPPDAETRARGK